MSIRTRPPVPAPLAAVVAVLGLAALAALYATSPASADSSFAVRLTGDSQPRSLGAIVAVIASMYGLSGLLAAFFGKGRHRGSR